MQDGALDFLRFLKAKTATDRNFIAGEKTNGTRLAQLMAKMFKKNLFADNEDPAWQKKTSKDRPLSGREDVIGQ